MAEVFLMAALFAVCLYYEKKKKDRKADDEWLFYCRRCLQGITNNCRDDCHKILLNQIKKYTHIICHEQYHNDLIMYSFYSQYQNHLNDIKNNYLQNVERMAKERLRSFHFVSLPDYLLEEYYEQIKRLHNEYWDTGYALSQHLRELSSPSEYSDK